MMQRLVGVGRVDAALDPGGEVFGRLAVAVQLERPIGRLAPSVRPAAVAPMAIDLPWLYREIVIEAQDAKGRDDAFAKVFVLVVPPDQHQVRVESVERGADRAEVVGHPRAVAPRGQVALIVGELGHEFSRPVRPVLAIGRHARSRQQAMEARRQPLVRYRQTRVVRAAKTENLAHSPAPPRCAAPTAWHHIYAAGDALAAELTLS